MSKKLYWISKEGRIKIGGKLVGEGGLIDLEKISKKALNREIEKGNIGEMKTPVVAEKVVEDKGMASDIASLKQEMADMKEKAEGAYKKQMELETEIKELKEAKELARLEIEDLTANLKTANETIEALKKEKNK